jgi:citronellyl-CoA dehydrogenase
MWTTNGRQADWVCLLCNTGQAGAPHRNKSLIIVPLASKGVTRGTKLDKLGMRSVDTAPLYFEDVEVPCRFRIGEEGLGFMYQMEQFIEERLIIAARTTTQLDATIETTVDYTRQRVAYKAPLLDHQWIHYRLAELQAEIESLRALVYRAVELYIAGEDVKLLTAAAKLQAGKLARKIPDECLQFWGGMGYMLTSPISRIARDLRLIAIGGGANEVMLSIIAKEMGTLPRKQRAAPNK